VGRMKGERTMTREAIEKLSTKHTKTIETYSKLICRGRNEGNKDLTAEYRRKLRGYLTAIKDAELITEYELRGLYLYYASKRLANRDK
jgi:hypothetical protein